MEFDTWPCLHVIKLFSSTLKLPVHSRLSLSTQVDKWVLVSHCQSSPYDKLVSCPGEAEILSGFSCHRNWIKHWMFEPYWSMCGWFPWLLCHAHKLVSAATLSVRSFLKAFCFDASLVHYIPCGISRSWLSDPSSPSDW